MTRLSQRHSPLVHSLQALRAHSHAQVTGEELYMVVNAGCREKDLAHFNKHLSAFKARC